MDYNTFAQNIKKQYPQYQEMDDLELSKKIVDKYPVYKDKVTLPSDSYLSRVGSKLASAGKDIASGVQVGSEMTNTGRTDVRQGVQEIAQGDVFGGVKKSLLGLAKEKLGGLKSALSFGGGVSRGISAPIEEAPVVKQTLEGVGKVIAPAIQAGAETETGQRLLELQKQYPEAFKSLQDVVDIASLVPVGAGAKVGATVAEKGLSTGLKVAKEAPSILKKAPNALLDTLATENPVKLAKIKTGVAKNLNEYASEFTKSRNAISGATNKIEGFDYGSHIAERNLLPNVTDSGRFDGSNIVKGLTDENAGYSKSVSDKLANSQNITKVEDLRNELLQDVTSKANIGDANTIRNYVDRYIDEVKNRYGDNLTDKQLYEIKLDADSGYNYTSPNADINASKIIADRARSKIRADKDVADLLDAQSKNYEAIRITQALEPYKVKAGNLSTRLAQLGGTLLGAGSVEGGIIQKTLAATIGGLAGQKLVRALQQSAFISPVARKAIEKQLLNTVDKDATKTILKKLDNGLDLTPKESGVLENVGNQLKKSSIIKNENMTANKTSIQDSIPLSKKTNQAGMISVSKDLQPLYKEAQKYKSAEEFVKDSTELTYKNLQENPYSIKAYGKDFDEPVEYYRAGDIKKNGDIWLTDNEAGAKQYSNAGGGTKVGSYIVQSKKPLIIDTAGGKYAKGNVDINKILTKDEIRNGYTNNPDTKQKFIQYAKDNGYDSVQFADSFPDGEGGMRSLVVFDKTKIKTKSQLEQIWKEANAKTSTKQGMTVINPLTVGAGVTAVGAGAMAIKNKKK